MSTSHHTPTNTKNALRPETAVIILLLRRRVGLALLLRGLTRQHLVRVLVRRVNVRLVRRHGDLDLVFVRADLRDAEVDADLVVAFRAPGDVVHVCELWVGGRLK